MSVESAEKALKELSFAMQIDPELAWSWHCNIAMVAQDAGALHKEANERTADFMRRAFDVDTTKPPIMPEPHNASHKLAATWNQWRLRR